MKHFLLATVFLASMHTARSWGFYAHQKINYYAVFLLPPSMLVYYKPHISFLSEHATDPDKRRYAVAEEGPRHYIDLDHYGSYPFDTLPRHWTDAVKIFGEDSLTQHGIVPWWIQTMLYRLTDAFRKGESTRILRLSAEIGHYLADAHVPLHTSSNHNGQKTGQHGIHGFWESRIPEILAEKDWDFFISHAAYLPQPLDFTWNRILESAAAVDSVLQFENDLSQKFPPDGKYAFEPRNGVVLRQYSAAFCRAYDKMLRGMIERRMRQSIYAVASFWYTAWVNAGQPDLRALSSTSVSDEDAADFDVLNEVWRKVEMLGRKEE